MRITEMSHEGLLAHLETTYAKVMNYPRNKSYPKGLEKLEKEILRRLGGNWEVFNTKAQ